MPATEGQGERGLKRRLTWLSLLALLLFCADFCVFPAEKSRPESLAKQLRKSGFFAGKNNTSCAAAPGLAPFLGQRMDINSAQASELALLPGIGPKRAARIISVREEHGAYTDINELSRVAGIGSATLRALRPHVCVQ